MPGQYYWIIKMYRCSRKINRYNKKIKLYEFYTTIFRARLVGGNDRKYSVIKRLRLKVREYESKSKKLTTRLTKERNNMIFYQSKIIHYRKLV